MATKKSPHKWSAVVMAIPPPALKAGVEGGSPEEEKDEIMTSEKVPTDRERLDTSKPCLRVPVPLAFI